MNRKYKLLSYLFSVILSGSSILSALPNAGALEILSGTDNISNRTEEQISEVILEHGITRKESVRCINRNYSASSSVDSYKYFTVRTEITYIDRNGVKVAFAFIETNFRYNTRFRRAKCLSTFYGQSVLDPRYSLSLFARTKNSTYENGEGFGLIKLERSGKRVDYKQYIFSCDYHGNVCEK